MLAKMLKLQNSVHQQMLMCFETELRMGHSQTFLDIQQVANLAEYAFNHYYR